MDIIIKLESDNHDQGKTSTLTILRNIFIADPTYLSAPNGYSICPHDPNDFIDIFLKNGQSIGISSCGDSPALINQYLDQITTGINRCNIIFTACGTTRYAWGRSTVAAIDSYSGYIKLGFQKTICPTPVLPHNSLVSPYNIQDAQLLYQLAEQSIK